MKFTVLVDNKSIDELTCEWGLAIYIEYSGKKILLDTGASGLFAENARALGIDLAEVEYAALSHAHFDHSDGMDTFFKLNDKAKMYISNNAYENCYHHGPSDEDPEVMETRYDGIKKGILEEYGDRIVRAVNACGGGADGNGACDERGETCDSDDSGNVKVKMTDGVWLVAHTTPGLEALGEKYHQYAETDGELKPDNYSHEQSLIFETEKGLVVFNSCSHGGVDNILRESLENFPGQQVYAMIGGFHQFAEPEADVRALARRAAESGVKVIVTGHCTGEDRVCWMRDELDGVCEVVEMHCGLSMEL